MATALLALFAPASGIAQPAPHKNVLVLHLGSESFPANPLIDRAIRDAFIAHPEIQVSYYAEYLESDPATVPALDRVYKDYLARKFADIPIDLVIANTDRVLRFALTYRSELFPHAPIVCWGLRVPDDAERNAGPGITGFQTGVNIGDTLKFAMTLQPELRRVFVVANHPDAATTAVARSVLDQVPGITLTYLDATTVRDLERAVRAVPDGTAILYVWHGQFQPGEVIVTDEVGQRVTRASRVPVYTSSEPMLGHGVVGGVVRSSQETGARIGDIAVRVLGGTRPQDIPFELMGAVSVIDWRELQRWKIPAGRVPAGTRILFREPTVWERYRRYVIGTILVLAAQAVLIGALLVQRAQRKRAVEDLQRSYGRVRDLGARLLSAQDEERARIARELHDDVSQRLALLKMELTTLRGSIGVEGDALVSQVLTRTDGIAEDLRTLSHRLHPSHLRFLGLVPSIASLQTELTRPGVDIKFTHAALPPLSAETTVSLFRVVQESLQNALKHGQATAITIDLAAPAGQVVLTVVDNGVGFDAEGTAAQGLGLTSMRERVDALRGLLTIRSGRSIGTTLEVRVPVTAASFGTEVAI